jgi:hypothetical protein
MQYRTHRPFAMRLLCVALASLISACGGGGSSQQPTAVVQPTVIPPTPTPSPSPTPSPTPSQPLALTPKVGFGDVVLNEGPALRRVGEDRYASVGKLLVNGKALQVIQALTSPYARLSVVSDPSDRNRYLVLLRTAEFSTPTQTSEYLCAAGNWATDDVNTLLDTTGIQPAACKGDIQFTDSGSEPSVVINGLSVANRLSSEPSVTVTTYLGTKSGLVDFKGFDKANHLFQEAGQLPLGQLDITPTAGTGISQGSYTTRLAIASNGEPQMDSFVTSDGSTGIDVIPVYATEAFLPVITMAALSNAPDQFVLFIQTADGRTNVACRSESLSEADANTYFFELFQQGQVNTLPGSPLEACAGMSYNANTHRLRLKDTVLKQKVTVRGAVSVKNSAIVNANINIWPFQ